MGKRNWQPQVLRRCTLRIEVRPVLHFVLQKGGMVLNQPDSPSTVPPYSPQHSSQNWSPPMHQGHNQHPHIQEVENHSAFRAYSPQTGNYSPYGHPSQFTPPPLHPSNHAHSYSWGSNSAIDSSQSQSGGPQFARVHQGPPQEMAGSGHQDRSWAGLGVHHVGNDYVDRPRAELGE